MRSKFLFLVGLSAGYVLGARAGRERYEQIRAAAERLWLSPRVSRTRRDVEAYARQQAPVIRARAESVAKAAPGAIADGARATVDVAKVVAEKTATVAKDVADRATTVTKDVTHTVSSTARVVADRVVGSAGELKGRVSATASELASELTERGEEARDRAVVKASAARDDALAEITDEDDR